MVEIGNLTVYIRKFSKVPNGYWSRWENTSTCSLCVDRCRRFARGCLPRAPHVGHGRCPSGTSSLPEIWDHPAAVEPHQLPDGHAPQRREAAYRRVGTAPVWPAARYSRRSSSSLPPMTSWSSRTVARTALVGPCRDADRCHQRGQSRQAVVCSAHTAASSTPSRSRQRIMTGS